jgi:hypothetical protein
MARDIQGVEIYNDKLEHWEKLLRAWITLTNRYCELVEGQEAPYYNNERANIGILAGAAWKAGWVSLEEFIGKKRRKKQGRCDLWIGNKERGEYIEAKHSWKLDTAKQWLKRALDDARSVIPYTKGLDKIGVLFISPGFEEKLSPNLIQQINNFKNTAAEISDEMAYSFPACVRELIWPGPPKKNYPGVFLLAKVVG